MVTLDRPFLFPNYYHKSAGLMLTAMLTASDKCTCQIGCCFAVPPCRTTAERHRYTAVQPTWILPADAAWRHHGQHKGWKQHILWVDVVCVYTSLDLFIVVMYNFNPIIYSVNDSTGYRNWVKKKKKKKPICEQANILTGSKDSKIDWAKQTRHTVGFWHLSCLL